MKEDHLIEAMRKIFVSIETFNLRLSPIEKIVYGACAVIGLGVVSAWIAFVLKKP